MVRYLATPEPESTQVPGLLGGPPRRRAPRADEGPRGEGARFERLLQAAKAEFFDAEVYFFGAVFLT